MTNRQIVRRSMYMPRRLATALSAAMGDPVCTQAASTTSADAPSELAAVVGISNLHVYTAMRGQLLATLEPSFDAADALCTVLATEHHATSNAGAGNAPAQR